MKKIIVLTVLFILGAGMLTFAQEQQLSSRQRRAVEKAREKAEGELMYKLAVQSLTDRTFVVEADKVTFKRGRVAYVTPTTNFVMMNVDRATVQVAFNGASSGPNGIGGITLDGSISNVKMKKSRKGNITYTFGVQGVGISAQVSLTMPKDSNEATVTISPNFSSNRITLSGYVVPLEESSVFKGRSL